MALMLWPDHINSFHAGIRTACVNQVNQCHACWCPGSLHHQVINSHASSIFSFLQTNLACDGLMFIILCSKCKMLCCVKHNIYKMGFNSLWLRGIIEFGQHWFRQWLVASWHQAIAWTSIDLSVWFISSHLTAYSQEKHQPSITKISLKITFLKFH